MHSSDTLRRRGDAPGTPGSSIGAQRTTSRIIASEQLTDCLPFTMHELTGDRAAAPDTTRASSPQERPASPFGRFDDTLDPIEQEGFEAGYRAGRDAGFAEGMKRGLEAGAAQAARRQREAEEATGITLAGRIEQLARALEASFAQVEREAADEVVALALDVARQVVRSSLTQDRGLILSVVQEALACLIDDRVRTRLHLHPSDASLVRDELGERLGAQMCEIVPDPAIEPGGCRIETPRALVDATVQARWRRVLAAIGRTAEGGLAIPGGAPE